MLIKHKKKLTRPVGVGAYVVTPCIPLYVSRFTACFIYLDLTYVCI
jgi:hypothetical protein